jgi:hypothetical protein
MAELLIRPGHNDHVAIANLLIPEARATLASVRRPISRLVVDAHLALAYPQYREAAAEAGTPLIIDPRTDLLQVDSDPRISWRKLPYASDAAWGERIVNPFDLAALVEATVDFQVKHGASAIVSPYFYAKSPEDPAFSATLQALRMTVRHLRQVRINLPLIAVLAGSHRGFARTQTFNDGIDRFALAALDLGPQALAFALSPNGNGKDGQSKVVQLFTAAQRLKSTGATVLAWRQGFFGPALVAAGMDGYETGTGTGEKTDFSVMFGNVKPGSRDGGGGGSPWPVFFEALGRSLPGPTAQFLLEDQVARSLIVCRDERCCVHGPASMVSKDNRRQHNIRTRAKALRDIEQMPHRSWRLHQIAKDAYANTVTTMKINKILDQKTGVSGKLPTTSHEALAHVAEILSRSHSPRAA